jgi:phosphoglycolate phosphatase
MARLIIFDFDGTLADTWRDIATALNHALRDADLPLATGPEVRHWIGEGVQRLIEHAVPAASADEVAALIAAFRAHYARCCTDTTVLYPGIAECLDALAGEHLAILSNKPTRFVLAIAERLGIAARFAAIVGGDAVSVPKPDPATVRHVIDSVGGEADDIWMIGDSGIDVATGRAAGAHTIGCIWGMRGAAELKAAGVDFLVDTPAEIPALISRSPSL